jgi:hypothetical protein
MRLVLMLMIASASARADEPAATVEKADEWRPPNRVWIAASGFGGASGFGYRGDDLPPVIGGLLANTGAELGWKSGLTFGFEVAPFTWVSETSRPSLTARLSIGWARKKIALGLTAGSALTWLYPQLGATLRIGALEASYARMRVSWAIYPSQPIPVDLDLVISTPVSKKLRTYVEAGAVYGNTIAAFATVGVQIQPRGSRSGQGGTISVGAGIGWMQWALGPMVTVGYERRL